jgi:hypothetical protein
MSGCEQATFFRTDDLEALERVIRDFCSENGLVEVPYVRGQREDWGTIREIPGPTYYRWAVALGVGRGGWSILKTVPTQLLDEQPGPWRKHRVGFLARALGCDALHVTLHDRVLLTLEQAAPTGEVVQSLYFASGDSRILSVLNGKMHEEYLAPGLEHLDMPRSVFTALERSPGDGFDELLEQLAGRPWADVARALVEGGEVPFARVLAFATPRPAERPQMSPPPRKPPLRVTFAVEEHPLGTRYVLDGGVWVEGMSLRAAHVQAGGAFVRKVSSWLGVQIPHVSHVPHSPLIVYAPPRESVQRAEAETELLSIGTDIGSKLLLRVARGADTAELEDRGPTDSRARLNFVGRLARALLHAPVIADAAYRGLRFVVSEHASVTHGTFAGERLVTAWRREGTLIIKIEGKEPFELPGRCMAIAGMPGRVALALDMLDDSERLIVIDIDTGELHEVLRSDEHLTFRHPSLCFAGDVLGIGAVRPGRPLAPVVVTLEGGNLEVRPGDFLEWRRGMSRVPLTVAELYSTHDTPVLWAGPQAVVVGPPGEGTALAVLDLRTQQRRPLFEVEGFTPLAFSTSGSRCLASCGPRRLCVGSIGYTSP